MDINLIEWRQAVHEGRILWRAHSVARMLRRNISRADAIEVLLAFDAIEHYPNDEPYPSVLLIGYAGERVLHVVAAFNGSNVFIITAYEPDLVHFEDGFRRRRT